MGLRVNIIGDTRKWRLNATTQGNYIMTNFIESAHQATTNCISDAAGWLSELPDSASQHAARALEEYAADIAPTRIAEVMASVAGRPYAALVTPEMLRASAADRLREALVAA